ncbi:MAG: AAA family ATPase [Rhodospirillales bacterium]|nr:AAA family ATPase [Rhodospirillales bacterium]
MTDSRIDEFFLGMEEDGSVRLIETHVSKVYLTATRAYKRKKPVCYPYLDYSTLKKRKKACEKEVELNKRTAPTIYLGTKAIVEKKDGSLSLSDGKGELIDWVVEMVRFDDSQLLSEVVTTKSLDRGTLEALAEQIAIFHQGAKKKLDKGGYNGLSYIINNNAECYQRFGEGVFDFEKIEKLNSQSLVKVKQVKPVLEKRQEDGFVRQCHGDMHLRNIFLLNGIPTLFDAIEFNDHISCIDVLYDLAFLLMDLDKRDLKREASIIFNRYMDITGDVSGLAALPLMLSMRASIRAHVGAAALKAKGGDGVEPRDYLDNALMYLEPHTPRLISVGGLSGSGKSRLARKIAPEVQSVPGALVLRTDAIRKRLSGVGMLERLGPEGYTKKKSKETYNALYEDARKALQAGQTVIADAVFAQEEERKAIQAVAQEVGVPFSGLWVSASPEIMANRVAKRKGNVSDATVGVLQQQLNYDLGEITWSVVDSSGEKAKTVRMALAELAET